MHTNQRQKEGLPPWGHDHAQYIAERPGERLGRWPANLIHDGSEEVVGLFPQAEGMRPARLRRGATTGRGMGYQSTSVMQEVECGFGDSGSAARFFYCAKASKQDRDEGLEAMPSIHRVHGNKWTDQDYRVARDERTPGPESGPRRNHHPTVKPTALMRYLCRLVTPPGGIVLDPFAGSGSTGKAAALEGFRFVGIEIDPEYLTIAAARIRAAVPPLFAGSLKNKGSSVSHRSPPVARRTKDGGLAGSGGRGELPFSARSRARVAHGPRVVLRSDDRVVSRD
jgi:site-specific DNA-methyltransferase (adenine-specific)